MIETLDFFIFFFLLQKKLFMFLTVLSFDLKFIYHWSKLMTKFQPLFFGLLNHLAELLNSRCMLNDKLVLTLYFLFFKLDLLW